MGSWNANITGNDTARDLYAEYAAAFWRYDVEEALRRIDEYVRAEMFDEADEEEWCNYHYSLADFMWKKGILTEAVRETAIGMIDSGFGLGLWAEAGQKTLDLRKKKLAEFREKLLSPLPPKKKIKPNVHAERIFEDGDVVAVQLQTAGKPFTQAESSALTEADFHALDGKYILMQLVRCRAGWTSRIAPEVKDYWACFRLFDGVYDEIPLNIDVGSLTDAGIHQGNELSSTFICESSMFYFKKRNYRVLCSRKDLIGDVRVNENCHIFWGVNKPWANPDSELIAAMGRQVKCFEFRGSFGTIRRVIRFANRYGRFDYGLSREENEARFAAAEADIEARVNGVLIRGGRLYCLSFGPEIGIVTVENGRIDHLYIDGRYRRCGFGTRLLEFAVSDAGEGFYMDVPASHSALLRVCEKAGLVRKEEAGGFIRMARPL